MHRWRQVRSGYGLHKGERPLEVRSWQPLQESHACGGITRRHGIPCGDRAPFELRSCSWYGSTPTSGVWKVWTSSHRGFRFHDSLGTVLNQQAAYWVDGPTDVKIAVKATSST